jgi:hypothetical protein
LQQLNHEIELCICAIHWKSQLELT